MDENAVDKAGLTAAMLSVSTTRLTGRLLVTGDVCSGRIWFCDGFVVYATLADGEDDADEQDAVLRAHRAIVDTLDALRSNSVMTIEVCETQVLALPEDPRFDPVQVLRNADLAGLPESA